MTLCRCTRAYILCGCVHAVCCMRRALFIECIVWVRLRGVCVEE